MSGRFWNNFLPAGVWLGYHAAIPQWNWNFLSGLMLLRALIVLGLFLIREEPIARGPKYQIAVAWVSTFLPVLMVWEPGDPSLVLAGQFLSIAGIVLFAFTALDLGKSFGVSPALRLPVHVGTYRIVRHPMYVSHVIVEAGVLIASWSLLNFTIAVVAWGFYWLRAKWEWKFFSMEPEFRQV